MRLFAGSLIAGAAVLLTSCSMTHMVSDDVVSDVADAADRVSDANAALASDIANFDSEDWQDVVPDIREHQEELAAAQDDLQSAIAEMKRN